MKYYIYLLVFFLLAAAAGASPAAASGTYVDVPVPASFNLSGTAQATDNCSGQISLGPGSIQIIRVSQMLYLRVPAQAGEGTTLVSLNDPESGILFRNNTMHLSIYNGVKVGTLIVTMDNLTADGRSYFGLITGLGLDTARITTSGNGTGFTAGAAIMLKDLPPGAHYRITFEEEVSQSPGMATYLNAANLSPASISPAFTVAGESRAARDAVSIVIVTIGTDDNWSRQCGDDNVSFYRYDGDWMYPLPFKTLKSGNGDVVYQAVAPAIGQFFVVARVPRDLATQPPPGGGIADAAIIGGMLMVLMAALAAMVRRVAKR